MPQPNEYNAAAPAGQYSRSAALFGQAALDKLRAAHVAVFGIGGVGGHAAEVLARSAIGQLSLFDGDTVSLSNLNRQLVALHSTLGRPKAEVMAERIRDIDPTIAVHPHQLFYCAETADAVNLAQFDYVVDCIDTVSAKLLLIERCQAANVPILCSMGAANKLDPTAFRVAYIEKTAVCPLAKVIRLECRRRGLKKVKVVYSEEPPRRPAATFGSTATPAVSGNGATTAERDEAAAPAAKYNVANYNGTAPNTSGGASPAPRTPPASNAFVPAACGLVIGAQVVKELAGVK